MMSVVIGFFFITGCDIWCLANSIIFLQNSLSKGLRFKLGTKDCNHLKAAWAKITEELEVQDCRTSNKYRETTLRGKGNCMLKCLLLDHSKYFLIYRFSQG